MFLAVGVLSLFIGWASMAAAAPAPDRTQALIKAASDQFQLLYRMRPSEAALRQEQLKAVVADWQAAPRSDANNERLTNWLREAIRSSMPGSRLPLPAPPNFVGGPAKAPPVIDPAPVAAPEPAAAQPVDQNTDPFRDDPIEMQETK
jgi:hypothetical protein